ncbi:MAG: DUF3427 domain-containing protein [Peptostreptococcaceae bacterium]
MLKEGLYEQVINKKLHEDINKSENMIYEKDNIEKEEAHKILSKYISSIVEKRLSNIVDNGGDLSSQIDLINKIIDNVKDKNDEDFYNNFLVDDRGEQLLSCIDKTNKVYSINKKEIILRPKTSISESSLFTGASNEPQMFSELKNEILSCDKIYMLVSFIKWSGLRLIIDELRKFTSNGGELRIITTSYMGATDVKAIEELRKLSNTEIKISYDTKTTRLHAKSYIFNRKTGFTTAYIGSSNMSNAALTSGLEWNIKVTKQDMPDIINKISATFNSYWNNVDFNDYTENDIDKLRISLCNERYISVSDEGNINFDIRPYSYQQEILDKLKAQREIKGEYKNLVIAATGTGKTVISAFDYKRFRKDNKNSKLLFVAHREEILKQSLNTFRHILNDNNFGDLFVGKHNPSQIDNLFISIQTFNSKDFTSKTSIDFYDYIIIDEFHHAASPTYQKILDYYEPKILLGLTATPERMDGKSILTYFNDKISAEIRLPEAIERKLLCPFQYFGITDSIDLDELKWSRGGYDKNELSNIYTMSGAVSERRSKEIANKTLEYVDDINKVHGLGFCVSIEHAKFMSDSFNKFGIKSIYLTGKSSDEERYSAKKRLVNGEIKFIFVVDIYNEGVDIPEVNTILFLRPTESLTVFLQQLGRGLRLSEDKECLTVLDFIGQCNKKYSFENKFKSLLIDKNRSLEKEIKDDFVHLPKGCYIKLERKAQQHILDSIKNYTNTKSNLIDRISIFKQDTDMDLNLKNFLDYYNLDIKEFYKRGSFYRLCVLSKVKENFNDELEEIITKSFTKFISINSRRLIKFILKVLDEDINEFNEIENRMLNIIHYTIFLKPLEESGFTSLIQSINKIKENKNMCEELKEILIYNYEKIDFVDKNIDLGFYCPLDLHCSYTRDQILVSMDFMKPSTVREGVKYIKDKNTDILFITLNKLEKEYSQTTMYNDYSINDVLFHWQSQSTTSETSVTGKRYINKSSKIIIFVREFKNDKITQQASSYTYLGTAEYVSHIGSRPMNIIWKLDNKIPARYLKKTNKLLTM